MSTESPLIAWFDSKQAYLEHERKILADCALEASLSSATHFEGICPVCDRATVFRVDSGARFDTRPNLREGLVCQRCRLTARQRTVLRALLETPIPASPPGAILERRSRLFQRLKRLRPDVIGSEYLGPGRTPGRRYLWRRPGRLPIPSLVRHESITSLSYRDGSLGYLLHTDVLEHVPDTGLALRECRRVLAPGRPMIFTAPFFSALDETVVRGFHDADGHLVELLPAEYHGDGVRTGGIYTYYNFGWSLFEQLRGIFPSAEIGLAYNPRHGLVQADSEPGPWNMGPIVFRCRA
jgi:hypothetical protein